MFSLDYACTIIGDGYTDRNLYNDLHFEFIVYVSKLQHYVVLNNHKQNGWGKDITRKSQND